MAAMRLTPAIARPSCLTSTRGQFSALTQGFQQAALVGNALARDVERRAVVNRGADHFQPHRHVDARLQAQHLDRPVALVVIHRHHQVEIATASAEEQRVSGQRAGHVQAALLQQLHRRDDLLFFFAVTEQAVLARVGVDAAHADARLGNTRLDQRGIAAFDGALHQARLDLADRVDNADVGGDVDHAQLWRHQHHRHFIDIGQVREHFGVAGVFVATGVQRFLVERRGADGVDLFGFSQFDGASDVLIRGVTGNRRQLSERQVVRDQVQVDAIYGARLVQRFGGVLDATDRGAAVNDGVRLLKTARITNHQRTALLVNDVVGQALDDDFRPDARGVAHGDADDRKIVTHEAYLDPLNAWAGALGSVAPLIWSHAA